jgi:phenylacetate-CoA ligase
VVPLPFLWVNGRRDATISLMGANIYPEDVEALLYGEPDVARELRSFQLKVGSDASGTPRPVVDLELEDPTALDPDRLEALATHLRDGLAAVNRDVRQSIGEYPAALLPIVRPYGPGEGPFAADRGRIKQRRLG